MALWNSKKKNGAGYSYLAEGASITGRLCFDGIIRIDGRVIGEIISTGTLVVEESAVINGTVIAENMILSGTILGDVQVYKHVQLNSMAKIYGHISYGELSMAGALHEGRCHKLTPDEVTVIQKYCACALAEAEADQEDYIPSPEFLAQYAKALEQADKQASGLLNKKRVTTLSSSEVNFDPHPGEAGRKIIDVFEPNLIDDQSGATTAEKQKTPGLNTSDGQPGLPSREQPADHAQSIYDGHLGDPSSKKQNETARNRAEQSGNSPGEANSTKVLDTPAKIIATNR